MNKRLRKTIARIIMFSLLICITSCGSSDSDKPSLQDIPRYPNSTEGESMEQSLPGGLMGGKLVQFTTNDPFDEVVNFYTDALKAYEPNFLSHKSDLGRQTTISIPQKNGMISIAIQEFTEENAVNITLMAVGS